jgi:16S rRNA (uracil1498-N3)-methyltransferase
VKSKGRAPNEARTTDVRLPWPGLAWRHGLHALPSAAAHYLLDVRRLLPGAGVVVFDGEGREARASLELQPDGTPALRIDAEPGPGRRGAALRLAYALPKGDKLDDVLRQVTELGVGGVLLFVAERSISRPETGDRLDRKRDRWLRIVEEAARQSGRADFPLLDGPMSLDEALAETTADATRLVLHPTAETLFGDTPARTPSTVFVGPEGGFSPSELARCAEGGVTAARLATPVLRTETAAVVAVALALHRSGAA